MGPDPRRARDGAPSFGHTFPPVGALRSEGPQCGMWAGGARHTSLAWAVEGLGSGALRSLSVTFVRGAGGRRWARWGSTPQPWDSTPRLRRNQRFESRGESPAMPRHGTALHARMRERTNPRPPR